MGHPHPSQVTVTGPDGMYVTGISMLYVVLDDSGDDLPHVYGIFNDEDEARDFVEWRLKDELVNRPKQDCRWIDDLTEDYCWVHQHHRLRSRDDLVIAPIFPATRHGTL